MVKYKIKYLTFDNKSERNRSAGKSICMPPCQFMICLRKDSKDENKKCAEVRYFYDD